MKSLFNQQKKRRLYFLFSLFVLVFLSTSLSAKVYINEIELNPSGVDAGNEWIELYNDGDDLTLTDWYFTLADGTNISFSTSIDRFAVIDGLSGLSEINEKIELYTDLHEKVDTTGLIFDTLNDDRTLQRIPDGSGGFDLFNHTKEESNNELLISMPEIDDSCVISGENITLTAHASGTCVENVTFFLTIDGQLHEFLGALDVGGVYSVDIHGEDLVDSQSVMWYVSVNDCSGNVVESMEQNFYVNAHTTLVVDPTTPDGLNGWYVSEPLFELLNPDEVGFFYKWDSDAIIMNDGAPFGLELGPNGLNETGGLIDLHYWAEFVCGEEAQNEVFFHFDFTDPVIENIQPPHNSSVAEDTPFVISAYIDEVYGGNSGVDLASVELLVDNVSQSATVNQYGSLDAFVFIESPGLSAGEHIITVRATDNAGRMSERSWLLHSLEENDIGLTVHSPIDTLYSSRRVPFDITTDHEMDLIEYINYKDNNPRFRTLCRNCNEYGHDRERMKNLLEGENDLTIRATDQFGNTQETSFFLVVDSRDPRITRAEPRRGYASGIFSVSFREENPTDLVLHYGTEGDQRSESVDLAGCTQERSSTVCEVSVDLSDFHLEEIYYFFELTDIIGNVDESRVYDLSVDVIAPVLLNYEGILNGRRYEFAFEIEEDNFDEITYIDYEDSNPRERRLCYRLNGDNVCERSQYFRRGAHDVDIFAIDDAGNRALIVEDLIFSVD